MKKKSIRPVFKEYTQGQIVLLPTDLEAHIPPKHLVRVVNAAIEKMDLACLLAQYKGGGTSSCHPKMLLKVLVYAYTQQLYSSRKIAKALRENIYFMWLSGNQQPDFRTINRFRSEVVKEVIEDLFTAVLELLVEEGYIKLENYFLDGTKIEANANKYSWVWGSCYRRCANNERHTVPAKKLPPNRIKPRLFIDADVLFAGCAGPSEYGASLVILRMAEITLIDAIVSKQVIDEAQRNLAAKMPNTLNNFAMIVTRCLQVQPNLSARLLSEYQGLAHPDDTPILAAAHLCHCPYLVTFNLRHYQPGHPEVNVLSPGDFLLHVRDRLTRL